jgi:hypothetical protein
LAGHIQTVLIFLSSNLLAETACACCCSRGLLIILQCERNLDFFTDTLGMRKYEAADGCVSGDERDSRTNTHPPRTAIIIVSQKHCEHSLNISRAIFLHLVYFLSHLFSSTPSSFIYLFTTSYLFISPFSLYFILYFLLFLAFFFSFYQVV